MTEAILIEIAQRRRQLGDAIEDLHTDTEFAPLTDSWHSIGDEHSPKSLLQELAQVCCDDMNRMADEIRKASA